MTGAFDSAGDFATGALVSRAVEPGGGEAGSHAPTSADCRNCGTSLSGQFCHSCGQNGHIHRTVGAIGHDLLHGVLHLEGKTWRTLPMLAFRPGELTRRYVAGERMRFVSPLAIFLFSVFLMFAVVAQLPGWNFGQSDWLKPGVGVGIMQARTKLAEEQARAEAAIADTQRRLTKARAAVATDDPPDPDRIATLERRLATATKARDEVARAAGMLATPADLKRDAAEPAPAEPAHSDNWAQAKWDHAKENPQLILYKVKTSAYKLSWALIPISLPFIWLLFPLRREVGLYDHAIIATYSLAFMSLLVIVLAVLVAIGLPAAAAWTAAFVIPPVHI